MSNKLNRLEIAEFVFLVGLIIGLIVAAIAKQVVYAIAPLSVLVCLNSINRRRFELLMQRQTSDAIEQVEREFSEQLKSFANYYSSITSSSGGSWVPAPDHLASLIQANINPIYEDLVQVQQQCANLQESITSIANYLNRSSLTTRIEDLEQGLARLSRGLAAISDQVDVAVQHQIDDLKQQVKAIQRKAGSRDREG